MSFAVGVGEMYRKSMRQFPRVPPDIVQAILIPLFFFALLSLQLQAMSRLPGFPTGSYAAFLLPQIIVFTAFTSANGAGYGLVLEVKSGYLDKLRAMPVPRSSLLLGRFLAVGTRALLQSLLIVGVAWIFGIRLAGGLVGLVAILLLAMLVAMSWAAIMGAVGLLTKSPEAVEASTILFLPLTYLTTGTVPLELMDPILQRIVVVNPVTYIIDGMRAFVLGAGGAGTALVAFAAAGGMALAGLALATWAMRRLDAA